MSDDEFKTLKEQTEKEAGKKDTGIDPIKNEQGETVDVPDIKEVDSIKTEDTENVSSVKNTGNVEDTTTTKEDSIVEAGNTEETKKIDGENLDISMEDIGNKENTENVENTKEVESEKKNESIKEETFPSDTANLVGKTSGYTNKVAEMPSTIVEDMPKETEGLKGFTEKKSLNLGIDSDNLKRILLNFIIPIVCLVVSIVLFFVVIQPSIKNKPELEKQLVQKKTLESQLKVKLAKLNDLEMYKEIVDKDSSMIDKVLVSEASVPELLSEVDTIARDSGFEVTRLSYSPGKSTSGELGYDSVNVSLGVSGNYDQYIAFLQAAESAARLIDIESFRYAASTKNLDELNLNIVVRSPYLFVSSSAATDEAININISDPKFLSFIESIKKMRYYDPNYLPEVEVKKDEEVEKEIAEETQQTTQTTTTATQ